MQACYLYRTMNIRIRVHAYNLLWIWLFNIVSFIFIDIGKAQFRQLIGDEPGEVILSDELGNVINVKNK